MDRSCAPVIGDSGLGLVVRTDSLRPISRPDLQLPRVTLLAAQSLLLSVVDSCTQHGERLGLVLVLGALVLDGNRCSCGYVCDAHGRVGGVDVLPACAT